MAFLEVIAAIERDVASQAKRSSYQHGVVGTTGSWRRPDRYRFAEVRSIDGVHANLLIYRNAKDVDDTPFDPYDRDAASTIARRIVDHLEI